MTRGPASGPGRPVLFLMPHLCFGGAERLAGRIAAHIAGGGRPVHVVVLGRKPGEADAGAAWFGGAASILRIEPTGSGLAAQLAALVAETGAASAALIGLSAAYESLEILRALRPELRVVSFQFNEHELSAEHRAHGHAVDLVIVEGPLVARTLVNLGLAEERLAVIPSGPDLARLGAASLPGPGGPPSGSVPRPLVGFLGRMDPIKGPHLFVEICGRLRGSAADFAMAGDGAVAEAVKAAIDESGLAGRVAWHGRLLGEAVPSFLRRCDVLVVPSTVDGRPLVVQEAQACGVAVVASRVGSIPDLIDHGESGLLCPGGDVEAFAAAVLLLLDDADLRRRIGAGGRDRVVGGGGLAAALDAYAEAILGTLGAG